MSDTVLARPARIDGLDPVDDVRSIAVMRRLGLTLHSRFDHARFPEGHRLRAHVAYVLDLQPERAP